jgi:hypothetical protein
MPPVIDPTELEPVATAVTQDNASATITTTLYDLIAAMQAVVSLDDDALIVATVWHVLCSGRITWRSDVVVCAN